MLSLRTVVFTSVHLRASGLYKYPPVVSIKGLKDAVRGVLWDSRKSALSDGREEVAIVIWKDQERI